MADHTPVYAVCRTKCWHETMKKEDILSTIQQAIDAGGVVEGLDPDDPFITKIKTINGNTLRFFVGEQSEYDALPAGDKQDLFAIITNDETKEEIQAAISDLSAQVAGMDQTLNGVLDGTTTVPKASHSTNATNATNAESAENAENAENATNAANINNLELKRDENGVLKIGDVVIPQRKLLFENTSSSNKSIYDLFSSSSSSDLVGRIFEIVFNEEYPRPSSQIKSDHYLKFRFGESSTNFIVNVGNGYDWKLNISKYMGSGFVYFMRIESKQDNYSATTVNRDFYLKKVYEIIE